MRNTRIYQPEVMHSGATLALDPAASHHLAKVLRCQVGDSLTLFNGSGGEFAAEVIHVGKATVSVVVGDYCDVQRESSLAIHLGIGISRAERMDWALQKATELGVTRITPLLSERVQGNSKAATLEKKLLHWNAIVQSASEQSGRTVVPIVASATRLEVWLNTVQADLKLILQPASSSLPLPAGPVSSVALLTGAEGGWSESEIGQAQMGGFRELALGPRVLRTETAPLAAIGLCQTLWGDFPRLD